MSSKVYFVIGIRRMEYADPIFNSSSDAFFDPEKLQRTKKVAFYLFSWPYLYYIEWFENE